MGTWVQRQHVQSCCCQGRGPGGRSCTKPAVQNLLYKTCPFFCSWATTTALASWRGLPNRSEQPPFIYIFSHHCSSSHQAVPRRRRRSPRQVTSCPSSTSALKDRDKALRGDPGELCGTFPFKSHPTSHCLAPLGQGSQEALPQLLAQHRGSKMMF